MTPLPIDPSMEPPAIRHGSPQAKQAYQVGVAFEQMLVSELSQQLVSGGDASTGGDSSADGNDTSQNGIMASDPASSAYGSLLPQALSTSIMSAGGTGIALQIAEAMVPSVLTSGARR